VLNAKIAMPLDGPAGEHVEHVEDARGCALKVSAKATMSMSGIGM
jgi:hypothetical protein